MGSKVTLQYFNTSPCEEEKIAEKIEEQGGAAPFFCTIATSSAIKGVGPFKNLEIKFLPGSLKRELHNIQQKANK